MPTLRLLFLPTGALKPHPFIIAAIAVYLVGAASQFLTMSGFVVRNGLWPFAAAQAVLTWVWLCVHANRLRDANRPIGLAIGVSVLYALSVILLLLIVAAAFAGAQAAGANEMNATSLVAIALLLSVTASLFGTSQAHDIAWLLTAILTIAAFVPVILAFAVSIWAATRPRAQGPVA